MSYHGPRQCRSTMAHQTHQELQCAGAAMAVGMCLVRSLQPDALWQSSCQFIESSISRGCDCRTCSYNGVHPSPVPPGTAQHSIGPIHGDCTCKAPAGPTCQANPTTQGVQHCPHCHWLASFQKQTGIMSHKCAHPKTVAPPRIARLCQQSAIQYATATQAAAAAS